jgi:hypothetical protein
LKVGWQNRGVGFPGPLGRAIRPCTVILAQFSHRGQAPCPHSRRKPLYCSHPREVFARFDLYKCIPPRDQRCDSRSRQRPRPAGFRHPHGTARSPGCLINPAALFASLYPSLLLSKLMKNQGHASVGRLGVLPLFPPVPPHPRSACGADVSSPVSRALRSRSRSRRCPTSGSAPTYPRPLPEPFDPAAGTLKSSPEHVHVRSRSATIRSPTP